MSTGYNSVDIHPIWNIIFPVLTTTYGNGNIGGITLYAFVVLVNY